jgi:HAE1 family hydrophobic/amphiphilic exporter-1
MGRLLERWGHAYDRLDRQYFKVLRWALAHPSKLSGRRSWCSWPSLSTLSFIGTEFVPNEDRGEFVVMVDLPPGMSFDETVKSVSEVERALSNTKEVRQVFTTVGTGGQTRKSQLRVLTTRKDERTIKLEDLKADLRVRLKAIPFADIKVADPEFMQGAPYEPPINVYVRGNDMTELKRLSDELVAKIRAIPGAVDVGTTLVSGQPELVAQVDRARAADLGFSVGSVATQVRSMVEGLVPSKLREKDHEFDIRGPSGARVPQRLHGAGGCADSTRRWRRRAHGRPGPDGTGRGPELNRP